LRLLPIAQVDDVTISAPKAGCISFYNSPYHPHTSGAAVDIYVPRRWHDFAPSPVEGRVTQIYEFTPPKSGAFPVPKREHLLILKSSRAPSRYTRLLHVAPSVKVGDHIAVGDDLGHLIRSGFFNFWTDPHIHVDVRGDGNLLRAKGSLPIHPFSDGAAVQDFKGDVFEGLEVASMTQDYALLRTRHAARLGGLWGVPCTVGEDAGLLDGGIPHYSCGGVYLPSSHTVKIGEPVRLGATLIGWVTRLQGTIAYFRGTSLAIHVNQTQIRGLSLYLFLSDQKTIKILPKAPHTLLLHCGESVSLSLHSLT
jgi:hypothetical protein